MKTEIKTRNKGFAIASLVTGIIGIVLFLAPYIGLFFSIIAIVFRAYKKDGSLSTAGLVLGIIGCILNSIMLLLLVLTLLIIGL